MTDDSMEEVYELLAYRGFNPHRIASCFEGSKYVTSMGKEYLVKVFLTKKEGLLLMVSKKDSLTSVLRALFHTIREIRKYFVFTLLTFSLTGVDGVRELECYKNGIIHHLSGGQ